ncbi:SDR family NAD(P)-dependent oxidoreductase, partial [Streptomyces europaeiscabiei]|uniref:SDR family NAD(P)-dependent oxidoreductase n=1 Tax=Streptomyces europaeiscabiei TaxID=146819 RepID=UPI0038F75F08
TGGAGGISKEAALCIAERGAASIVIADLNPETAAAAAGDIQTRTGVRSVAIATDVSDPASIEALFAETTQTFGALH